MYIFNNMKIILEGLTYLHNILLNFIKSIRVAVCRTKMISFLHIQDFFPKFA